MMSLPRLSYWPSPLPNSRPPMTYFPWLPLWHSAGFLLQWVASSIFPNDGGPLLLSL